MADVTGSPSGESRYRLFVAVELGPAIVDPVGRMIDELRRRASQAAPRARVTWVDPQRLHVTLQFIGEVTDPAARDIAAALADPVRVPPFDITVAGTGAFPPRGAPRVIWAGLTGGVDTLRRVADDVAARLLTVGVVRDDRPFSPHLTLGRVRVPAGLRTTALLGGLADVALGVQHVDAITLMQSRLSPKGPSYTALQRTPLECTA